MSRNAVRLGHGFLDASGRPGFETTTLSPTNSELQERLLKRKAALLHSAVEMSTEFGCDVGLIVFDPAGHLCQFSTSAMELLLKRYSSACTAPHEVYNGEQVSGDELRHGTHIYSSVMFVVQSIPTVALCSSVPGISFTRASASAWRTGVSHPKGKAQKRKA